MKKIFLASIGIICALPLFAQQTELSLATANKTTSDRVTSSVFQLKPAVLIRASVNFTWMDISYQNSVYTYNTDPYVGAQGSIGAYYEYPVSNHCILGIGAGGSYARYNAGNKERKPINIANPEEGYKDDYKNFGMTTIHADLYYGGRFNRFYFNLGLRGAYVPLMTATMYNAPQEKKLTSYHYRNFNIWLLAEMGYSFGRIDLGLNFNYAFMAQFKEGFSYPIDETYIVPRTTLGNIGVSIAYRFGQKK